MKKWKRINNSDRKKEKLGKVRFIIRGFMDNPLEKIINKKKHKFVTVSKV